MAAGLKEGDRILTAACEYAANYGAYSAVKEAIRALTRAAASEWGGEGIPHGISLAPPPGHALRADAISADAVGRT